MNYRHNGRITRAGLLHLINKWAQAADAMHELWCAAVAPRPTRAEPGTLIALWHQAHNETERLRVRLEQATRAELGRAARAEAELLADRAEHAAWQKASEGFVAWWHRWHSRFAELPEGCHAELGLALEAVALATRLAGKRAWVTSQGGTLSPRGVRWIERPDGFAWLEQVQVDVDNVPGRIPRVPLFGEDDPVGLLGPVLK